MTTATATLHELQHDFPAVEKAAKRGPVRILREGEVVGTFTTENTSKKWTPPDFAARAREYDAACPREFRANRGPIDVRDYIG